MNFIVTNNPEFFYGLKAKSKQQTIGDLFTPAVEATESAWVDFTCIRFGDFKRALARWTDWAADSETTGLDWTTDDIFCAQFGNGQHNFIVDMMKGPKRITPEELFAELNNPDLRFTFHNGGFDLNFWTKHGFVPKLGQFDDTMIASQILSNGIEFTKSGRVRHSFAAVMKRRLKLEYDKTEQSQIHRTQLRSMEAIAYCFNDVDKLLDLREDLVRNLRRRGAEETYRLQMDALAVVEYAERFGMPISKSHWVAKCDLDKKALEEVRTEVENYIWDNLPQFRMQNTLQEKMVSVKTTSPLQMIKVFKALGIPTETVDKKTGKVRDSIDKKTVKLHSHDFCKLWVKYSDALGRVTKFGDNITKQIKRGDQGYDVVYHLFKLMVDTGRVAAGGKSVKQKGAVAKINALNLQSDKSTRDCFRAPEGYTMIVCDYSGQETVILADKSLDDTMVRSVEDGLDLHCAFARLVYPDVLGSLSDDEIIEKFKNLRSSVKAPRFAFSYGAGARTVQRATGLTLAFCKELEHTFKKVLHPKVFEWGQSVLNEALEDGYIESVDGWRLYLQDFDVYREHKDWWRSVDKSIKQLYYEGRNEYYEQKRRIERVEELRELKKVSPDKWTEELLGEMVELSKPYIVCNQSAYDVFQELSPRHGMMRKMESDWLRLALNNPIQTTGSHMIKRAMVEVYREILNNGHYGKVLIWNFPYDEMCLMAPTELAEHYRVVLENAMRSNGDRYLKNLKIKADASIGASWYEAK